MEKNVTNENKKNSISKKNGEKSNGKIVIKNPKRLIISVAIILMIIIILIIFIVSTRKVDISKVDDYSTLNSKKYSSELLDKYQTNESKEKFLEDYDYIQGAVGLYIMNNSTTDNTSFSQLITNLKEILKKDDWTELDIDKPTFWNGTFDVTDEGIVTFKFGSKDIEPSWTKDDELNNKIIFNS